MLPSFESIAVVVTSSWLSPLLSSFPSSRHYLQHALTEVCAHRSRALVSGWCIVKRVRLPACQWHIAYSTYYYTTHYILSKVIGKIISENQLGFVPRRLISEATHLLQLTRAYLDETGDPGLLLLLRCRSVNHGSWDINRMEPSNVHSYFLHQHSHMITHSRCLTYGARFQVGLILAFSPWTDSRMRTRIIHPN